MTTISPFEIAHVRTAQQQICGNEGERLWAGKVILETLLSCWKMEMLLDEVQSWKRLSMPIMASNRRAEWHDPEQAWWVMHRPCARRCASDWWSLDDGVLSDIVNLTLITVEISTVLLSVVVKIMERLAGDAGGHYDVWLVTVEPVDYPTAQVLDNAIGTPSLSLEVLDRAEQRITVY